jgi:hypothetical protein
VSRIGMVSFETQTKAELLIVIRHKSVTVFVSLG